MSFKIRPANRGDASAIYNLVRELAIFEKLLAEFSATEEQFRETLFDSKNNFHALVLEEGGRILGTAVYFYTFSTFLAGKSLFLEDLIVPESERGKGFGRALLTHLAEIAKQQSCVRMEWNVLKWNQPAIAFYEAIGAEPLNEWVTYRLGSGAIYKLAAS